MSSVLCRRAGRRGAARLRAIDLDPAELARFVEPLPVIEAALAGGVPHALVLLELTGRPVGFYVLRPDGRDGGAWWLAYLAIGRSQRGRGLARLAIADARRRLSATPGARRLRLLVVPDNLAARRLYAALGFLATGAVTPEGDLVLEAVLRAGARRGDAARASPAARVAARRRRLRLRPRSGRHAAPVLGTERGPPPGLRTGPLAIPLAAGAAAGLCSLCVL